jgi:RNA polymerase sigma factor (sigma-70 family)
MAHPPDPNSGWPLADEVDDDCRWVGQLYETHVVRLLRFATRVVGDPDGGEDKVHRAFEKLLRRVRFRGRPSEDNLDGYLFVLVKNECLREVGADQRNLRPARYPVAERPVAGLLDGPVGTRWQYEFDLEWLSRYLSPNEQFVVGMIREGYTRKEIAGVLGVSPKTVDRHRSQAVHKGRQQACELRERCPAGRPSRSATTTS